MKSPAAALDLNLLVRQWWAMTLLTLRRYRQSQHIWIAGLLAAIPVLVVAFVATMILITNGFFTAEQVNTEFLSGFRKFSQAIFTGGIIHFGLIFLTLGFGNSVFREEIDQQTYHYYMLSHMPRWMIVAGKFSGFILLSGSIYIIALLLVKFFLAIPLGPLRMMNFLFSPAQIGTFFAECGVLLVALMVYGALFMLLSMFFKNVLYGLFIYAWELGSNFMPELLRNFSLAYHIKAMLPYQSSDRPGFVGVLAEGPGPIQIIVVLTGVFVVCIGISAFWATRKQCLYGTN